MFRAVLALGALIACAHHEPSAPALKALGESQVCTFSTDCTGMLPRTCAQWACVHGACEIARCEGDAGTPGR